MIPLRKEVHFYFLISNTTVSGGVSSYVYSSDSSTRGDDANHVPADRPETTRGNYIGARVAGRKHDAHPIGCSSSVISEDHGGHRNS